MVAQIEQRKQVQNVIEKPFKRLKKELSVSRGALSSISLSDVLEHVL